MFISFVFLQYPLAAAKSTFLWERLSSPSIQLKLVNNHTTCQLHNINQKPWSLLLCSQNLTTRGTWISRVTVLHFVWLCQSKWLSPLKFINMKYKNYNLWFLLAKTNKAVPQQQEEEIIQKSLHTLRSPFADFCRLFLDEIYGLQTWTIKRYMTIL